MRVRSPLGVHAMRFYVWYDFTGAGHLRKSQSKIHDHRDSEANPPTLRDFAASASQQTQVFSETRLLSPLLHCSNRTSCPHRARLLTADVHLLLQPKMKLRRTFHVFLLFVCAKSLFQYYNFIYMLHLNDLKGPGCDRLRCFNTQVKNL